MSREETGPFRMPIVDKYKVCGLVGGIWGVVRSVSVVGGSGLCVRLSVLHF